MSERKAVYDPDWNKVFKSTLQEGEAHNYSVDTDMWATRENITTPKTLSSAVWSVVEGNSVTVGSDAESDNVSTALVTASNPGRSIIKVTLTMSDSQIGVQYIHIYVPDLEGDTEDYP